MALFDLNSIKMRLRRNATITPSEVLILIKDMDLRLQELENARQEKPRLEKAKPGRPRSGGLSQKKVPSD
jgi:hypothetical protein